MFNPNYPRDVWRNLSRESRVRRGIAERLYRQYRRYYYLLVAMAAIIVILAAYNWLTD